MPTTLLPELVTGTITTADTASFDALMEQIQALFPKTPNIEETFYKALDKVGPVKKAEFDAKIAIMEAKKPTLSAPLSVQAAKNKMAVGLAALSASARLKEESDDKLRLGVIALAEAYNIMKCSAEDIHIIAKRGRDEVAKATHNEIEAYDLKRLADLAADKARIEARANKIVEEKLSKAAEEVKKII